MRWPSRACSALRADDPQLVTDAAGRVTLWPNRSGLPADATPPARSGRPRSRPARRSTAIPRPVLRFDGQALLEAPRPVPRTGSLFIVFRTADYGQSRRSAWSAGKMPTPASTASGLMLDPGGRLARDPAEQRPGGRPRRYAPGRRDSRSSASPGAHGGTTLHRNGAAAGVPEGDRWRLLRPGHRGPANRRTGFGRQPPVPRRSRGGPRLRPATGRGRTPARRSRVARRPGSTRRIRRAADAILLAELYEELLSPRGPFWLPGGRTTKAASPRGAVPAGRACASELEALRKKPPAGDSPGGRRPGRRPQGHAPRGLQGRPGLHPRRSQEARQDRAARLPEGPGRRSRARADHARAAAGCNWPTGWLGPTTR